jgi:excinuclease ABC subunit C
MRDIKTFLANLSHHSGVYQMLDEKGHILYVGKAKDLKKRVSSYFSRQIKDPKTASLVSQIYDISITITHNENEAVLLECNLIKKHKPRYNILLRDDKSYPYILISKHDAPRIDIYRGARNQQNHYFGPYPNSYAVRETISLLQKLFLLRTCRDSYFNARTRPCLLYQIGRCSAPCVDFISPDDYAQSVKLAMLFLEGKSDDVITFLQTKMEQASQQLDYEAAADFRDQIGRLRQIQEKQHINAKEGNLDVIALASKAGITGIQLLTIRDGQVLGSRSYFPTIPLHSTEDEILTAFITQHYLNNVTHLESMPQKILVNVALSEKETLENVLTAQAKRKVDISKPQRGDKLKWLKMAMTSANQALITHVFTKANMYDRLLALQTVLKLEKIPERVECFDISHTQGEATIASCVVFDKSGALKNQYRRYNMTDIKGGDDVAAMHQVLFRRFKKLQSSDALLPDIALIDGGKTQLAAARKALDELNIQDVLLMGVSKGPDRKAGFETLHREGELPIHLPEDSLALHFIQQIRDEAHRFAIAGHRAKREKARRQSSLEFIPGIGAKKRRELLRYFGGIQGISHASLDELLKVPGISRSLAERIFESLHDATI